MWNDMMLGWNFPLRLSAFLASCTFVVATSNEKAGWYRLGQIAFVLNSLRLLGRLLSTFAGQHWLDAFNNTFYFPAVFFDQRYAGSLVYISGEKRCGRTQHGSLIVEGTDVEVVRCSSNGPLGKK
jgi:hypothetical protein